MAFEISKPFVQDKIQLKYIATRYNIKSLIRRVAQEGERLEIEEHKRIGRLL
jgi:hypothetical protein